MSQCDSPYVTRYFGSYVSGTKLWIVMEYVGGGSVLVRSTPTHGLRRWAQPQPAAALHPAARLVRASSPRPRPSRRAVSRPSPPLPPAQDRVANPNPNPTQDVMGHGG